MDNPRDGRHVTEAKSRADDARAKAAKDIAAAERCDRAEALLPATVTADNVHQFSAYTTVAIELTALDRAEALDLLDLFRVLPLARVKLGCLAFKPAARITASERERADILEGSDLWPVIWHYDPSPHLGDKPAASLQWFADLGDGITADVRCAITSDPARVESSHQHAGKTTRSRIVRYQWTLRDGPNGSLDRFASGSHDRCGQYVAYFHVEPNNGPTPADYLRTRDADCECSTDWDKRSLLCARCVELRDARTAAYVARQGGTDANAH